MVIWLEDEALEEGGCICIDVHCVLIMAFQSSLLTESSQNISDPSKSRVIGSYLFPRVAEVGSISARAKMTIKAFVKRVFTIFVTNTLFLRVIANLHI